MALMEGQPRQFRGNLESFLGETFGGSCRGCKTRIVLSAHRSCQRFIQLALVVHRPLYTNLEATKSRTTLCALFLVRFMAS